MPHRPQRISELPDTCDVPIRLSVPRQFRRGGLKADERVSIASALNNLKGIATLTGRDDWSELKVLDYGCGVKFSQALLQYELPVGAYVGMDVYADMIRHLQQNVSAPNFRYHVVPFQNAMYRPNGVPLSADAELPGEIRHYDLITLQSVFTHFAPADFQALLHVLSRHAAPDARMLFTCFINNEMDQDFRDKKPERPLFIAQYREAFVRQMVETAQWRVLQTQPPAHQMQHQFVCAPS